MVKRMNWCLWLGNLVINLGIVYDEVKRDSDFETVKQKSYAETVSINGLKKQMN